MWKNYKKKVPSRDSQGTRASRSTHTIILEGHVQVVSGFVSLPDPVSLRTKDQTLEREQSECDVLETLVD